MEGTLAGISLLRCCLGTLCGILLKVVNIGKMKQDVNRFYSIEGLGQEDFFRKF